MKFLPPQSVTVTLTEGLEIIVIIFQPNVAICLVHGPPCHFCKYVVVCQVFLHILMYIWDLKLFRPVKPFLVYLHRKTEKLTRLKRLVFREPLFIQEL